MTACAGGVRRRVTDDGKSTPTRLVKHAFHDTDTDILADSPTSYSEDTREDVGVGVGVVECGHKTADSEADRVPADGWILVTTSEPPSLPPRYR